MACLLFEAYRCMLCGWWFGAASSLFKSGPPQNASVGLFQAYTASVYCMRKLSTVHTVEKYINVLLWIKSQKIAADPEMFICYQCPLRA